MSELTIDAEEIAAVLERHVSELQTEVSTEQVGRISEVGDGIAHVAGLPHASVNELLEFENGTLGLALNLDEDEIGAVVLGDVEGLDEGQTVRATGRILSVPVGDVAVGPRREPARRAARRQGIARRRRAATRRNPGTRHRRPPAGFRAAADRHQGHRRADAHRTGPTRTHNRRPQNRQDDGRRRHDPQSKRCGREVHLRGDRPERLDRRGRPSRRSKPMARSTTRSSSRRRPPSRRRSSTWRHIRGARWASTGWNAASTR